MTNLARKIRPKVPLKELTWLDLLILTAIFWGVPIYTSTLYWVSSLSTSSVTQTSSEAVSSSASDWLALTQQGKFLLLALAYLFLRNFDFKQLKIQFRWNVLFWAPFIFLGAGLLSDLTFTLYSYIPGMEDGYNYLAYFPHYSWSILTALGSFANLTTSTIVYSLFNGFYEEFFFLGLLLSSSKKQRVWVLVFSTLVRTSFHTYQGLPSALVIGVSFGLFYYYLYSRWNDNLLPYFLSHALADMVGTSFFSLFLLM